MRRSILVSVAIIFFSLAAPLAAPQPDCNNNQNPDSDDIANGNSSDCNANAIPDECDAGPVFTEVVVSTAGPGPLPLMGADLDGDGDTDIVAGEWCGPDYPCGEPAELKWYENLDGLGSFGTGQAVVPSISDPHSLDTGDLDGDGDLDIAVAWSSLYSWFANDGTGSFGPERRVFYGWLSHNAWSIEIVDLDGDGDLDLLTGGDSSLEAGGFGDPLPSLAWFENTDGVGTFGPPISIPVGYWVFRVTAADLDGDGDPDILAGGYTTDYFWLENTDGHGTFGPEQPLGGGNLPAVVAADLDRDGDNDVLAASRNPGSIVLRENTDGAGSFGPERLLAQEGRVVSDALATDLDGDHDLDIVAVDHDWDGPDPDRIIWLENTDGAGAFSGSRTLALTEWATLSTFPENIAPADLNGDGAMDLIASQWYTDTLVWYRQQDGDCNRNDVPDDCDIASGAGNDCNTNDIPDECEQDCDANGVPDVCDASCTTCDTDGDGCLDETDSFPFDALSCGDSDADGCDDCSNGSYDPWTDGANADGDGVCDIGDCVPSNGQVWAEPQPVTTLRLEGWPLTRFVWQLPDEPGSLVPRYDLLRTEDPAAFGSDPECILWDLAASSIYGSSEIPEAGGVHFYLVRLENDCPGPGAMGSDSTGQERTAPNCP